MTGLLKVAALVGAEVAVVPVRVVLARDVVVVAFVVVGAEPGRH
jgi:hypothetical protein